MEKITINGDYLTMFVHFDNFLKNFNIREEPLDALEEAEVLTLVPVLTPPPIPPIPPPRPPRPRPPP